eukprot:TRINITY_DN100974_c0_g1_i1.p1 TRINITY_DN100974_c0_g1~~TRINITY_DN100974_c0_g1_i1.p1  ORF type:complete len:1036 (+),score=273.09 TRINITY_DN100974_c0_g1_i1:72-3179(+)
MLASPQALLVLLSSLTRSAHGALNLAQSIEQAIFNLRDRVFIANDLLTSQPDGVCDSVVDGPFCEHIGLGAPLGAGSIGRAAGLLTDGVLSARLFGSSDGGELLDELMMQMKQPEPKSKQKKRSAGRGRSALLSFAGLPPWTQRLDKDFAGSRRVGGGVPFAVTWDGPWMLTSNPLRENSPVVKAGRFVAQLRGAVGSIRFGRPVHLQAVDLARPSRADCLQEGHGLHGPPLNAQNDSLSEARFDAVKAPMPLVVRGRLQGQEMFTESIPFWELGTFVNGVAFSMLTMPETLVDEVTFLVGECVLVGILQLTFDELPVDKSAQAAAATASAVALDAASPPAHLLSLRDAWRAYSWEDINFRTLATARSSLASAPVASLSEVVNGRLTFRHGVFMDLPIALDGHLAEEDLDAAHGPESMRLPPQLQESLAVPASFDTDGLLQKQKNASMLLDLYTILAQDTLESAYLHGSDAALLRGLDRKKLNKELLRLLEALTEFVEGAAGSSGVKGVGALSSAGAVFDATWRRLGLDALDTLLVRWATVEAIIAGSAAPPETARQFEEDVVVPAAATGTTPEESAGVVGTSSDAAPEVNDGEGSGGVSGGVAERSLDSAAEAAEQLPSMAAGGTPTEADAVAVSDGAQSDEEPAPNQAERSNGGQQQQQEATAQASEEEEVFAVVPEARLTRDLVSLLKHASEIVHLRVGAKQNSFQMLTSRVLDRSAVRESKGVNVKLDMTDSGEGIRVTVGNGGRSVTSEIELGQMGMETLLEAAGVGDTSTASSLAALLGALGVPTGTVSTDPGELVAPNADAGAEAPPPDAVTMADGAVNGVEAPSAAASAEASAAASVFARVPDENEPGKTRRITLEESMRAAGIDPELFIRPSAEEGEGAEAQAVEPGGGAKQPPAARPVEEKPVIEEQDAEAEQEVARQAGELEPEAPADMQALEAELQDLVAGQSDHDAANMLGALMDALHRAEKGDRHATAELLELAKDGMAENQAGFQELAEEMASAFGDLDMLGDAEPAPPDEEHVQEEAPP